MCTSYILSSAVFWACALILPNSLLVIRYVSRLNSGISVNLFIPHMLEHLHSSLLAHLICFKDHIQGVNKVRRHCSITYNFRINVHSILKLYRHTNRFNTKVRTLLPLIQLYFI